MSLVKTTSLMQPHYMNMDHKRRDIKKKRSISEIIAEEEKKQQKWETIFGKKNRS